MIQIDDAGSGSLIGGTSIGVIRAETGEYYNDIIPIKLYNETNFKKKLYLLYVNNIIEDAFKIIKPREDELVQICRGYMFDEARKMLDKMDINYISTKIGEPLQSCVENTFENYIISLGLPRDFIKFTRYPFHFHRLLRWVYADYSNRVKLCKTGWKSWQKYGHLQVTTYQDILYDSNFYCLKCGKRIQKQSAVKVIKYVSNMPNTIYIHKHCL